MYLIVKDTVKYASIGAAIGAAGCSSPFLLLTLIEIMSGQGNAPISPESNVGRKIKDPENVTAQRLGLYTTGIMLIQGTVYGALLGGSYGVVKSIYSFFYPRVRQDKSDAIRHEPVQAPSFGSKKD